MAVELSGACDSLASDECMDVLCAYLCMIGYYERIQVFAVWIFCVYRCLLQHVNAWM